MRFYHIVNIFISLPLAHPKKSDYHLNRIISLMNTTLDLRISQVVPLSIFCFFMTTVGIIGNATVIYSTVRYKALKLDAVSLLFIQNLALADIVYVIVAIFPSFVTYSARGWVLGQGWCFVQAQLAFTPGFANSMLVLAITVYRLLLFTVPHRAVTIRTGRLCVTLIWSVAIFTPAILNGYLGTKGVFQIRTGACISSVYDDATVAVLIISLLLVLIPIVIITIVNISICIIAIRHSTTSSAHNKTIRRRKNKSLVMTGCLSGVFVLSWMPQVVSNLAKPWFPDQPNEVYILAYNSISINSCLNPVLYSLTNKNFRKYVLNTLSNLVGLKPSTRRTQMIEMRNIYS